MRKIKPDDVKKSFIQLISSVENFYSTAENVLSTDKDKTLLVEITFISSAVLWEGFLNDLFIAYINRDSTEFAAHLGRSVGQSLEGKPKRIYDNFGRLSVPAHMDKATISNILDEQGQNITFRNYDEIQDRAKIWLSSNHRQGIEGLNAREKTTIDAWISIRNFIAHRSKSALDQMNDSLAKGALYNSGLRRGQNRVNRIGAYLKAKQSRGSRLQLFIRAMKATAEKM